MKIQVTEEDIRNGEQMNTCECPIARALKRNGLKARVLEKYVAFGEWPHPVVEIDLPHVAVRKIENFDNTGYMTPFTFELDLDHAVYPK
jgi:hypothetical protein